MLLKIVLFFVLISAVYAIFFAPPSEYPLGTTLHIMTGKTVAEVATLLVERGAIASPLTFTIAVRMFDTTGVQSGTYALHTRQNVVTLAHRFATGATNVAPVKVTIPEGSTIADIEEILNTAVPDFDADAFRLHARGREGYLFPETYFFAPGAPADVLISAMTDTYATKIMPLQGLITASGHTEVEVITMASLLEKEARKPETMRIVAGILWKRIAIGMPLQVDAVFGYIKGIDTYNPSLNDLKIESPYNTYLNKGLPPGPIGNPGLGAIKAALEPVKTPYLYYLTGRDGTMHYARTFDEHIANRKYLR